ncbi:hypothetical protein A6A08_20605 [Nocardiopsis sp. TSRI0078]|nr:hypothetical protein A6A08_20605 [Nocardiopsis sp. TSRI0078]
MGREAGYHYIDDQATEYLNTDQPVLSVEAKKKEVLGDYVIPGRERHRLCRLAQVRAHDFPEKGAARAVPYGTYRIGADTGWVGSGYRARAGRSTWPPSPTKRATVCHFPSDVSKGDKVGHRLFSAVSTNWRGRTLTSHEVVVNTIAETTTRTGLRVHAGLDPGSLPHHQCPVSRTVPRSRTGCRPGRTVRCSPAWPRTSSPRYRPRPRAWMRTSRRGHHGHAADPAPAPEHGAALALTSCP